MITKLDEVARRAAPGACVALLLVACAVHAGPSKAEPSPSALEVLVVNTGGGSVSLVDLGAMKEVRQAPVGKKPYGIAVTRDGKTVAVGVEGEEMVKFFTLPDFSRKGEVRIGAMKNDHITLSEDGAHVLVANYHSDSVVGLDVATMAEAFRIEGLSAPHVVKYGPKRKHAFVTCKKWTGIGIIDPAERKLVAFHPTNVNPRSLTFSPDESKLYFGSFWVNGIFEMDVASGTVSRFFHAEPPKENAAWQEVTYHGVEAIEGDIVLAANEGRSSVDAFDVRSGRMIDRLAGVPAPCCVERLPGSSGAPTRALVSNLGDGSVQLIEVSQKGKIESLGKVGVGDAPKRVAFLPLVTANSPPSVTSRAGERQSRKHPDP
jgi:YVTN family beta-propeller protein